VVRTGWAVEAQAGARPGEGQRAVAGLGGRSPRWPLADTVSGMAPGQYGLLRTLAGSRSPRFAQGFFIALGIGFLLLAVLATTSESSDKVALTVLAVVAGVLCLGLVPLLPRLIRWEESGGDFWHRKQS
jgi:hypothetical protein